MIYRTWNGNVIYNWICWTKIGRVINCLPVSWDLLYYHFPLYMIVLFGYMPCYHITVFSVSWDHIYHILKAYHLYCVIHWRWYFSWTGHLSYYTCSCIRKGGMLWVLFYGISQTRYLEITVLKHGRWHVVGEPRRPLATAQMPLNPWPWPGPLHCLHI